jgi:hypothetical protein
MQIDIHKRPEFLVVGVKMSAQFRVLGNQSGQGLGHSTGLDLDSRLLPGILA